MTLNKNQVSKMQQASWKLAEAIHLLKQAGLSNGESTVKKMKASLDEIEYTLNHCEVEV